MLLTHSLSQLAKYSTALKSSIWRPYREHSFDKTITKFETKDDGGSYSHRTEPACSSGLDFSGDRGVPIVGLFSWTPRLKSGDIGVD